MKTCTNARAIRQILCAIDKVVHCMNVSGFSVDVEITTENGVIYEVTYMSGKDNPIKLTDYCVLTDDATISLNYISKIVVKSSEVTQTKFIDKLTCEIYRIMRGVGSCADAGEFVACMQKFINCNKLDIESVNYNGGMETVQPIAAVTDIKKDNVLGDVTLNKSDTEVLEDVELVKTAAHVAGPVSVSSENVVTDLVVENALVALDVTQTMTEVSPPLVLDPEEVVTDVVLDPTETRVVTSVTSTTKQILQVNSIDKQPVATGFESFTEVDNVLGGITAATNTSTTEFAQTPISVAGTGVHEGKLQIIVPPNTFGDNIPETTRYLEVVVDGDENSVVSIGEDRILHAFANATSVLAGVTGVPTFNDLSIPNALTKEEYVRNVVTGAADVASPIDVKSVEGRVVRSVAKGTVNSPEAADPINVVDGVAARKGNIKVVDTYESKNLQTMVTSSTQTVVGNADITKSPATVLNSASLNKSPKSVVTDVETGTVSVLAPVNEPIEGDVVCAGNGIMTVENTNGDVSLYNLCDVNAVTTSEE